MICTQYTVHRRWCIKNYVYVFKLLLVCIFKLISVHALPLTAEINENITSTNIIGYLHMYI